MNRGRPKFKQNWAGSKVWPEGARAQCDKFKRSASSGQGECPGTQLWLSSGSLSACVPIACVIEDKSEVKKFIVYIVFFLF